LLISICALAQQPTLPTGTLPAGVPSDMLTAGEMALLQSATNSTQGCIPSTHVHCVGNAGAGATAVDNGARFLYNNTACVQPFTMAACTPTTGSITVSAWNDAAANITNGTSPDGEVVVLDSKAQAPAGYEGQGSFVLPFNDHNSCAGDWGYGPGVGSCTWMIPQVVQFNPANPKRIFIVTSHLYAFLALGQQNLTIPNDTHYVRPGQGYTPAGYVPNTNPNDFALLTYTRNLSQSLIGLSSGNSYIVFWGIEWFSATTSGAAGAPVNGDGSKAWLGVQQAQLLKMVGEGATGARPFKITNGTEVAMFGPAITLVPDAEPFVLACRFDTPDTGAKCPETLLDPGTTPTVYNSSPIRRMYLTLNSGAKLATDGTRVANLTFTWNGKNVLPQFDSTHFPIIILPTSCGIGSQPATTVPPAMCISDSSHAYVDIRPFQPYSQATCAAGNGCYNGGIYSLYVESSPAVGQICNLAYPPENFLAGGSWSACTYHAHYNEAVRVAYDHSMTEQFSITCTGSGATLCLTGSKGILIPMTLKPFPITITGTPGATDWRNVKGTGTLAVAMTAAVTNTTVSLTAISTAENGDTLVIGTELMVVTDASDPQNLIVVRGSRGTTIATHGINSAVTIGRILQFLIQFSNQSMMSGAPILTGASGATQVITGMNGQSSTFATRETRLSPSVADDFQGLTQNAVPPFQVSVLYKGVGMSTALTYGIEYCWSPQETLMVSRGKSYNMSCYGVGTHWLSSGLLHNCTTEPCTDPNISLGGQIDMQSINIVSDTQIDLTFFVCDGTVHLGCVPGVKMDAGADHVMIIHNWFHGDYGEMIKATDGLNSTPCAPAQGDVIDTCFERNGRALQSAVHMGASDTVIESSYFNDVFNYVTFDTYSLTAFSGGSRQLIKNNAILAGTENFITGGTGNNIGLGPAPTSNIEFVHNYFYKPPISKAYGIGVVRPTIITPPITICIGNDPTCNNGAGVANTAYVTNTLNNSIKAGNLSIMFTGVTDPNWTFLNDVAYNITGSTLTSQSFSFPITHANIPLSVLNAGRISNPTNAAANLILPDNNISCVRMEGKDNWELKMGHTMYVHGNIMDGAFNGALQQYATFILTPRGLGATGAAYSEDDIVITNNLTINQSSGIRAASDDNNCQITGTGAGYSGCVGGAMGVGTTKRVIFFNNLFLPNMDNRSPPYPPVQVQPWPLIFYPRIGDWLWQHNTAQLASGLVGSPPNGIYWGGAGTCIASQQGANPATNFWIIDNVFGGTLQAIGGGGCAIAIWSPGGTGVNSTAKRINGNIFGGATSTTMNGSGPNNSVGIIPTLAGGTIPMTYQVGSSTFPDLTLTGPSSLAAWIGPNAINTLDRQTAGVNMHELLNDVGNTFTGQWTRAGVYMLSGTITGPITANVTLTLSGPTTATTTSLTNGTFTFYGLAPGSYTVTPSFPLYTFSPASVPATISTADVTVPAFTSVGATLYTLLGTVSNASNVTITAVGPITRSTVTGAGGTYSLQLMNGSYTVTPSLIGYSFSPASASITVNNANPPAQNFTGTVVPTYTISGTVSGIGTSAAIMTLTGPAIATQTQNTGTGGTYSFTVIAGSYTLTPTLANYTFSPANASITVINTNILQNFAGSSGGGGTGAFPITCNVSNGVAPPGVLFTISGDYNSTCIATQVGTNIQCRFNVNAGNYIITPSLAGYTFTPASRNITVTTSTPPWQQFTAAFGHNVSGTIQGIAPAGVQMQLQVSGDITVQTAITDINGNYLFSNVADGGYIIIPLLSGYTFLPDSSTLLVSGTDVVGQNFTEILAGVAQWNIGSIGPAASGAIAPLGAGTKKKKEKKP